MEIINRTQQKLHAGAVLSLFHCEDDVKVFEEMMNSDGNLKNGIDYGVLNKNGDTIFHHYIKTNKNILLNYLINKIGRERLLLNMRFEDEDKHSLIMSAVKSKNWVAIDCLNYVVHGDVDEEDTHGWDSDSIEFESENEYEDDIDDSVKYFCRLFEDVDKVLFLFFCF